MKKPKNFANSLILHIRYPWTTACLLVLWVGLATMCTILHFSTNELMLLISLAGIATLIISVVGFRS